MIVEGPDRVRPSHLRLYALLVLMVFFWAMNFIVGKIALRSFPPLLLSMLRTTMAGALILPVYVWRRSRRPLPDGHGSVRGNGGSVRDVPVLLLLGVLGVAANQVLFVAGLSRTSVAHSSLVIGLTPVLVLVAAAAFGLEQLTARKFAGMAIALAGILALNSSKTGLASISGDLLIFCSTSTFALFTVGGKRVSTRVSALTMNTFAYVGGAVALLPIGLWYWPRFSFASVPAAAWATVAYMAALPSVVCYLIYYHALTKIPASRVSAFSYLQPLLASAAGALVLGERITGNILGGGLLVLAGVYLTERG